LSSALPSWSANVAADLDALQTRLRATFDALQPQPAALPGEPAVAVEVIAMPAPRHRWLFTVVRDNEGRIESVLAEPLGTS